MTSQQLIYTMATEGGCIVSTASCSEVEIANARAHGRMAVTEDGLGYILRPKDWLTGAEKCVRALIGLENWWKDRRASFARIDRVRNAMTDDPYYSVSLNGLIGETPDGSCLFEGEVALGEEEESLVAAINSALADVNWHDKPCATV